MTHEMFKNELLLVADCALLMLVVFCLWGVWFLWNHDNGNNKGGPQ